MASIFDTLPFRMIRGTLQGFEDGFRGKVDTNEKFRGGYRENDPEKKSAAGQFVSDYMGVRGGAATGKKLGTWGGGIASALWSGNFLYGFVTAGLASGMLVGAWPIIGAVLLTGAAAVAGATVFGVIGEYAGGVIGAITGSGVGAGVGLYNGTFKKGVYQQPQEQQTEMLPPGQAAHPHLHGERQASTEEFQRALKEATAMMEGVNISNIHPDKAGLPQQEQGHVARLQQQGASSPRSAGR